MDCKNWEKGYTCNFTCLCRLYGNIEIGHNQHSIYISLLGCCTRFSFTLIMCYSQMAKIKIPPIHPVYTNPYPLFKWRSWLINEVHFSQPQFHLPMYPRILYPLPGIYQNTSPLQPPRWKSLLHQISNYHIFLYLLVPDIKSDAAL